MGWSVEVNWHGAEHIDRLRAAEPEALRAGMEHIGEVAASLTPVEEGTLVRSQRVEVEGNTAQISSNTPYSRYQHEKLSLRHPNGGQAKFIEQPMLTEKDTALAIVARTLGEAL